MATKQKNSSGFAHIALLGVIVIIAGLVAYSGYYLYKTSAERQQYAKADKTAQAYINAIESKYPGKVTTDNGCSRTSAKYGEGSLGCSVRTTLEVVLAPDTNEGDLITFADKQKESVQWQQTYQSEGPGITSPMR